MTVFLRLLAVFFATTSSYCLAEHLEAGAHSLEDGSVRGAPYLRAVSDDSREVKQLAARCNDLMRLRQGKSIDSKVRGEIDTIAKALLQLPPELYAREIHLDSQLRLVDASTQQVVGSFDFNCFPPSYLRWSEEHYEENRKKLLSETLRVRFPMSPRDNRYATYAEKALLHLVNEKIGTHFEETLSTEQIGALTQLCRDIIRLPASFEGVKLSLVVKPVAHKSWDFQLFAPDGSKLGKVHLWVGQPGEFYTQVTYDRYPDAVKVLEDSTQVR